MFVYAKLTSASPRLHWHTIPAREEWREKGQHNLGLTLSSESTFPAPQNTDVFFSCFLAHTPDYNHFYCFFKIADQGQFTKDSLLSTASAKNGIDVTSPFSAKQLFWPWQICSQLLLGCEAPVYQWISPICFPRGLPSPRNDPFFSSCSSEHGAMPYRFTGFQLRNIVARTKKHLGTSRQRWKLIGCST